VFLVSKTNGSNFKFTNQAEYEKVSKYMIQYVKHQIMNTYKQEQIWLPSPNSRISRGDFKETFSPTDNRPQADIYVSPDFLTNKDKLLCLIQGTGSVRAGIWARSVCINEDLELGSVIPFLKYAKLKGMAAIIFNPNERKDPRTGVEIPEFTSMEKHCLYVWENVVEKYSNAKEIYFVSHSMGGYCTVELLSKFTNTFLQKVKKNCFY